MIASLTALSLVSDKAFLPHCLQVAFPPAGKQLQHTASNPCGRIGLKQVIEAG